jgi:hypothetical protein
MENFNSIRSLLPNLRKKNIKNRRGECLLFFKENQRKFDPLEEREALIDCLIKKDLREESNFESPLC